MSSFIVVQDLKREISDQVCTSLLPSPNGTEVAYGGWNGTDLGWRALNFRDLRVATPSAPLAEPERTKPAPSSAGLNSGLIELLKPGAQFGNYVLESALGSGSFGEVWKALDRELGRPVALKFPIIQTTEALDRLRREAKAAAILEHPNIARIYAFEEQKGRRFIAMQYVDGVTLDSWQYVNVKELLAVFCKVASAVHVAHTRGVIHRDLKPRNLMIDNVSQPYVMDFGLARIAQSSTILTANGIFVGTEEYASPEQKACKNVDARSDVYALGVTLQELLTGALPQASGSSKGGSKSSPIPGGFPGLEGVIEKCLQSDPDSRFQTAQDLADSLQACLGHKANSSSPAEPTPVSPPAPQPATTGPRVALGVQWAPETTSASAGFDLLLEPGEVDVDDARIAIQVPTGFGILRLEKPGGWHQDPKIGHPRIWIDRPEQSADPVKIGRLCFYDLSTRLKSPIGTLRWTLAVKREGQIAGSTEVMLERLIPPKAKLALGSSRRLSFRDCSELKAIPFHMDGRHAGPTLEFDPEENCQVLRSADPEGQIPVYFPFEPPVHLTDLQTLRVRWKAIASKHLMMHLWFGAEGDKDLLVITYKSVQAGDSANRKHSDTEWVSSLDTPFGTGVWTSFELNLTEELRSRFGDSVLNSRTLRQISLRGNYWLGGFELQAAS